MINLYHHQKVALSYLRNNDSFALYMEQGPGKTIGCLVRILEMIEHGTIDSVLVVAPKSALGAWERDMDKFDPDQSQKLKRTVKLINYESVWRKSHDKECNRPWDMIILDEAHAIKNRASKQSAFLLKLAVKSKYRYILTGTPISNGKLEDIWSQLTFLEPFQYKQWIYSKIFTDAGVGGSYYKFLDRYALLNQYYRPYAYRHIKELQEIINQHSYTVKKVDCLDLPEKLPDEVIYCDLLEKDLYRRMADRSAWIEYEIKAENPLSRLVKLRELCAGYIRTDEGNKPLRFEKIPILKEILEGFDDQKKVVIFAEFKYSILAIRSLLREMQIKSVVLDGEQKNKQIWREFQTDPTIRVIICQYKSGNAGIDLYASDTIIYYEPTLKSDILAQSRDRIHRHGQKNVCSYIHLLTKGTVEENIYNALTNYQDFTEKLFTEYLDNFRKNPLVNARKSRSATKRGDGS